MKARGYSPKSIVDVGAAAGEWSHSALGLFPDAQITMLEPLPLWRHQLEEIAARPNVTYIAAAAGSEAGSGRLLVPNEPEGASFLDAAHGEFFKSTVEVPVVVLDELKFQGPPSLLKLDVQGFELHVLEGARKTLQSLEVLIAEVSFYRFQKGIPLAHEVVEWVCDKGFVLYDVGDETRDAKGTLLQCDFIFVAATSPLAHQPR